MTDAGPLTVRQADPWRHTYAPDATSERDLCHALLTHSVSRDGQIRILGREVDRVAGLDRLPGRAWIHAVRAGLCCVLHDWRWDGVALQAVTRDGVAFEVFPDTEAAQRDLAPLVGDLDSFAGQHHPRAHADDVARALRDLIPLAERVPRVGPASLASWLATQDGPLTPEDVVRAFGLAMTSEALAHVAAALRSAGWTRIWMRSERSYRRGLSLDATVRALTNDH